MILLEDGLPGPWPIVQVIFKSYLPSKKSTCFGLLDSTFLSLARVNKSHAIIFYTDFAPPSKRSLNFHDGKKAGENGLTVNGFHQNNNTAARTKSKKRDCDELFLPLSDDDDDTNGKDKLDSTPGNETLEIKVHLHHQPSWKVMHQ